MHIADGVLSAPVWMSGFAATAVLAAITTRNMDNEEIPKVSVVASAFFVATLIHFPVGATSIHLILNGLIGIVLGVRAFPAILLGLALQAIIFQHGGVSVIGVNAVMIGGGALVAYGAWLMRKKIALPASIKPYQRDVAFGALAGAIGIISSGVVLALALATSGEAFWAAAQFVFWYHIPLMLIEGAVAGACVGFLLRVKPSVLSDYQPPNSETPR